MNEHDLREGLRSAVVAEPPLGFSTTELVDTARRNSRRRRTALATTAAVGLVVAGSIGAVAATGGLASPDRVEPAMKQTEVMRKVGESIATGLPSAVPGVEDVSVAAEKHGGVVTFTVDGKLGALVYEVANCTEVDYPLRVPAGICPSAPSDLDPTRPAAAVTGPRGNERTRVFWAVNGVAVQLRAMSQGEEYQERFGPRFCDIHHPVCRPEERVLPGFGRLRTFMATRVYVPAAHLVAPRDPAEFEPSPTVYRPKHDYVREQMDPAEGDKEKLAREMAELERELEREREKNSGGK